VIKIKDTVYYYCSICKQVCKGEVHTTNLKEGYHNDLIRVMHYCKNSRGVELRLDPGNDITTGVFKTEQELVDAYRKAYEKDPCAHYINQYAGVILSCTVIPNKLKHNTLVELGVRRSFTKTIDNVIRRLFST